MAGLRKFPKLTSSYSHTHRNDEAVHQGKEASHNARPSSAPSSTQAGRHLLASRQQHNKPYYKVTYPLRQRRKVNFENQINAAPNAEYTVTGRGYTFTRHNNKLTMNINTEVFFDDKGNTAESASSSKRKPPSSPMTTSHKQRISLQHQLEESAQIQEKLQKALVEATVKLEEQKLEQENLKAKMLEEHGQKIKELTKLHEGEKKKIIKAHDEMIFDIETQHASKLADQQTTTMNREMSMKEEILHLNAIIKQNIQKHETEIVNCLKQKEEELNAINHMTISDLKIEMADTYRKQLSARLKALQKEHDRMLAERMIKHKNEIEDLISRFKDSAQIEDDFKKASKLLKDSKTEVEHLTEEKKELTMQLRSCKAELQETMSELKEYRRKFQNKVDEVKEQCDNTINRLTNENIDLRKRLLKKTEELSDLKMEEDKRIRNLQFNLKKSIIQARVKANLPVALGLHEQEEQDDTKDRQGSAPITRQEKDTHRKRLSSVEQEQLSESSCSQQTHYRASGHSKHGNK